MYRCLVCIFSCLVANQSEAQPSALRQRVRSVYIESVTLFEGRKEPDTSGATFRAQLLPPTRRVLETETEALPARIDRGKISAALEIIFLGVGSVAAAVAAASAVVF